MFAIPQMIKPWKLLSVKDVSPSKWFPIEERTYELPNGKIIDDFSVTTLADVSMIVPITTDKKVVMVRQFKPGVGDLFIQFPAGRLESHHESMEQLALHELEEESGIRAQETQLHYVGKMNGFSTKATEVVYVYVAEQCEFNSSQHLDNTEEIEILTYTPSEIESLIIDGTIWAADAIAAWELTKKKYPQLV